MENRIKSIGKYMTAAMVGSASYVSGGESSPRPNLLVILPDVMQWAGLVRADGWKLARYNVPPEQRPETDLNLLFRLSNDKFELNNLAGNPEYQSVFSEMKAQLQAALDSNGAVLFSMPATVKGER